MEYSYPIDTDWSTEEITKVIHFFNCIEQHYEQQNVSDETIISNYKAFKQVVPSKALEKKMFKQFERSTSYKVYDVVKAALNHSK